MDLPLNEQKQKVKEPLLSDSKADGVEIVCYTDPLCCWSWAMEPQWRKLQYKYQGRLTIRYCMGGLIPSWKNFSDPVNSVSRPLQMGPVWMEARHVSGMPVDDTIWMKNPPASSYLACIAVKCAGLQSPVAEEKFLRVLREAVMIKGQNIAVLSVLVQIAESFAHQHLDIFNSNIFKEDMQNDRGLEAFRSDLQEVQYRTITRFPTFLFRRLHRPSLIVTGYRPYAAFEDAMKEIAPDIQKVHPTINVEEYVRYWGAITDREVAEVSGAVTA